jgi:hypothetical protein
MKDAIPEAEEPAFHISGVTRFFSFFSPTHQIDK